MRAKKNAPTRNHFHKPEKSYTHQADSGGAGSMRVESQLMPLQWRVGTSERYEALLALSKAHQSTSDKSNAEKLLCVSRCGTHQPKPNGDTRQQMEHPKQA